MRVNTAYHMLWGMHEARKALADARKGERRLGLLHLTNAWRHIGTATAGARPRYLSDRAYWVRMSCVETVADMARVALSSP